MGLRKHSFKIVMIIIIILFSLNMVYSLININSFIFLILRIVPEVFIGDMATLFPEISVTKANADTTISFVLWEHRTTPKPLVKLISNNHKPTLLASFKPKYFQIEAHNEFTTSFWVKTNSLSFINLKSMYRCLSFLTISFHLG